MRNSARILLFITAACSARADYTFTDASALLNKYCLGCHQGKKPSGGFAIATTKKSLEEDPRRWTRMLNRVREREMPPPNVPAPDMMQREQFVNFVETSLKTLACADGIAPGPGPVRRLNRAEYAATVRDLLNIHVNAGRELPADGAGGEGFDNAAETLFLSPVHIEKYLEAAKQALEYGSKDPRSRAKFIIAEPSAKVSPERAARKILEAFVPNAYRRQVSVEEVDRYMALFAAAQKRGDGFEDATLYAMQGVLISPEFLFRIEEPNTGTGPRPVNDYELASRLSYFLWGSMPDDSLFDAAATGSLHDPDTLRKQVARMLKDERTTEFAERFVEQWLNTRELGKDIKPDAKLFPAYYDAEIQSAIRYEPILFFQEVLNENLSLLNLIDSKFTILTAKLSKFYGYDLKKLGQQPRHADLPENSRRGGLLGMAAVLAVSSYPHRTSPVLRGKWILESMLGTPPPPPPPNVPELKEAHEGEAPKTLRERLTLHRQNAVCASCHNRIDPLGFALENYDVLGRWRTQDAGKPIDNAGELPDGTSFAGADQLKKVLLDRKDVFLRNLTAKMLGYALGRGLILEDYCTVDHIVEQLAKNGYSSHTLITEIVLSVPFRYRAGTTPNTSVAGYDLKKQERAQ